MRWEQLFAELEGRFDAAQAADEIVDAASRVRAEQGRIRLVDRLGGAVGRPVTLTCRGVGDVSGLLVEVGVDWLLLVDGAHRQVLVSLTGIRAVAGLGARTAVPDGRGQVVRDALDLRRALRALARDRQAVQLVLDDGTRLTGTVDRVGADFLELAEHELDEPRRRSAVRAVRTVVLDAVAVVRSTSASG